jgi:hypothetical protein
VTGPADGNLGLGVAGGSANGGEPADPSLLDTDLNLGQVLPADVDCGGRVGSVADDMAAGPRIGLWHRQHTMELCLDAGMGGGALGFGLLAEQTGYPMAFALTAVLMLTAVAPHARPDGGRRYSLTHLAEPRVSCRPWTICPPG